MEPMGFVFFGSVASIFVLSSGHGKVIPFWLSCLLAAVISLAWVVSAQNIRASTDSWRKVIIELESGQSVQAFSRYKIICDTYDRWDDLLKTLRLWESDESSTRHSVSRILVLFGILSFGFFLTIALISFIIWVNLQRIMSIIGIVGFFILAIVLCIRFFSPKSKKRKSENNLSHNS